MSKMCIKSVQLRITIACLVNPPSFIIRTLNQWCVYQRSISRRRGMSTDAKEQWTSFQMMLGSRAFFFASVRFVTGSRSCRCLSWISAPPLSTMKQLIDSQQYQAALDLFHRHHKTATDPVIGMALKAAMMLRDYQSGIRIHRQLTQQSMDNPYTRVGLIHFYSE